MSPAVARDGGGGQGGGPQRGSGVHLSRRAPPLFPYSHEIRNQWGAFRASFNVHDLDVERLILDQPHHFHMERPNNYFFASYFLKETRAGNRYWLLPDELRSILSLLDRRLRDLEDRFYVSIVDFENNVIWPAVSRASNVFEARFPRRSTNGSCRSCRNTPSWNGE